MKLAIRTFAALSLCLAGAMAAPNAGAASTNNRIVATTEIGRSDARQRYEALTDASLVKTGQQIEALDGQKDALPNYESLDEAWAAIKSDWAKTKTMVGNDWREGVVQFERDYQALKRQVQRLSEK